MIFARYKKNIDGLDGDFVLGKAYFGEAGSSSGGAVGISTISIVDENDTPIREKPDDGRFEYSEEIFAVVVKSFGEYDCGEVVVITDARQNGNTFFEVSGEGFFRGEMMVILDRTNVSPGTSVLDLSVGRWLSISSVDECLWFRVQGGKVYRSPSEFQFTVSSDGDILESPMKRCVNPIGLNLTNGNLYQAIGEKYGQMSVLDDGEIEIVCSPDRFEIL